MSRIHDMGGRYGDGQIPDKEDDTVFHSEWEAKAMATTVACGALGAWNIDAGRHARERLSPRDYARFSYYEKWIAALSDILVERDLITPSELECAALADADKTSAAPRAPLHKNALRPGDVLASQRKIAPYTRPTKDAPLFAIGDSVRTSHRSPNQQIVGGHTRLPNYAMGKVGKIVLLHGAHVFPDSNAHFKGEAPQPLYAVEFTAHALWGDSCEAPDDRIVLDLWQSYLEGVSL
ncbi:MAG: nitrile hydratase subunit beta [Thalassovita sp.]